MKHFLSQLGNRSKSLIYMGMSARGEVMGNTFTTFTPSPVHCIPPIGGRWLRLSCDLAELLRGLMTNEGKEGLRRGFDLVPMPPIKSVGVTGGSTVLLSLPTSEKKSGEKSW